MIQFVCVSGHYRIGDISVIYDIQSIYADNGIDELLPISDIVNTLVNERNVDLAKVAIRNVEEFVWLAKVFYVRKVDLRTDPRRRFSGSWLWQEILMRVAYHDSEK